MRLLQASSRRLVYFDNDKIPPYAILSHTWGSDEVLLADIGDPIAESRPSYLKIKYSCDQALKDGWSYVWIDTCCIDKSSSAELSEAINSMYQWYQNAEMCYAYLSDVSATADMSRADGEFAFSKWFTRGWTLQELLAPAKVVFYSKDWTRIGLKEELCAVLEAITGVQEDILSQVRPLESASVAERMSWASRRTTTRREDVAYSLMGIFGVNMPMLYGEGDKAFLRLQEEIMRTSDDQSLFAWVDSSAPVDSIHGLLATSPKHFRFSNAIITYQDREVRAPFSMSNRGLNIELHLTRLEANLYIAALDCPVPPDYEDNTYLGIYLRKLSPGEDLQYARVKVGQFGKVQERGNLDRVYVRQSPVLRDPNGIYPHHVFQLRKGPAAEGGYKVIKVITPESDSKKPPDPVLTHRSVRSWIPADAPFTFRVNKGANRIAFALLLSRSDGKLLTISLGSTSGFRVAFSVSDLAEENLLYQPTPPYPHPYSTSSPSSSSSPPQYSNLSLLPNPSSTTLTSLTPSSTSLNPSPSLSPSPSTTPTLTHLEKTFHPHTPGTYIATRNHQIRVDVEEQVHAKNTGPGDAKEMVKFYMVDIEVIMQPGSYIPIIDPILDMVLPGEQKVGKKGKKVWPFGSGRGD